MTRAGSSCEALREDQSVWPEWQVPRKVGCNDRQSDTQKTFERLCTAFAGQVSFLWPNVEKKIFTGNAH